LHGQRAVPTRLQTAGFAFAHPTVDAALRDLIEPE
jgi:NAD dependent epimerase/dehydratase family enzyme